jgi:hypothetical protein
LLHVVANYSCSKAFHQNKSNTAAVVATASTGATAATAAAGATAASAARAI